MFKKLLFKSILLAIFNLLFINSPVSAQIPPPYVPCNQTRSPEFHTLRPYQASPCELTGVPLPLPATPPALEPARLYCGNDMLIQESFSVLPGDAISPCVDNGNDTITCDFLRISDVPVAASLSDAELPIMGNAQLVPNQVNNGNPLPENLAYNRRTAEYVSWYLNGTIYRMEEFEYLWDICEDRASPNHDPDLCSRLISTYSGPINKLLPGQALLFWRLVEASSRAGNDRHNQFAYCSFGGEAIPVPCNSFPGATPRRLSDLVGPIRDSWLWWFAWVDTNILDNFYPSTFPFVPISSTENRIGMVEAYYGIDLQNPTPGNIIPQQPNPQPPSEAENLSINVNSMVFNNNPSSYDYDWLYLSHLEESKDLLILAQRIYLPREYEENVEDTDNLEIKRNELYYNTYRCDLTNARWNTGDDVFGEIPPPDISGTFNYTATFQCTFVEPCFDPGFGQPPACGGDCGSACTDSEDAACDNLYPCPPDCDLNAQCKAAGVAYCNDICSYEPCDVVTAAAPFSVYTRSPLLDEIWGRSVVGPQSVMKRIYPRIEPVAGGGTLAFEILDLPGVTTAHYTSTASGVSVYAGNFTRPGSRADIFYPHLGGIYEYFLYGIKDALLPYQGSRRTQQPVTRPQPATLPLGCNWDSAISGCHYYSTSSACQTVLDRDPTNRNPLGNCPPISAGRPMGNDANCGDPICEGRRCNPYEWSLPNDYLSSNAFRGACTSQPTSCIGTGVCTTINSTNWANDEYSDPRFNGCYYAVGPGGAVRVRTDAWDPGRGGCAAVCNWQCK